MRVLDSGHIETIRAPYMRSGRSCKTHYSCRQNPLEQCFPDFFAHGHLLASEYNY